MSRVFTPDGRSYPIRRNMTERELRRECNIPRDWVMSVERADGIDEQLGPSSLVRVGDNAKAFPAFTTG